MSLWLAIYLLIALVPPTILIVHYGWQAGATGRDVIEDEEVRTALWLGALWPLYLASAIVFAAAFVAAWLVRSWWR